jgi:hypothetical protein
MTIYILHATAHHIAAYGMVLQYMVWYRIAIEAEVGDA